MKQSDIQVTLIDHMGTDLSVVNAARVSFNKESNWEWDDEYLEFREGVLKPGDVKLINYLAKHKHFSPFNHSFITLRVKAPIFVARQLVKHKFMPINEVSRRYVTDEPEFYFPEYWRKKADNVKQGSSDEVVDVIDAGGWNWISPQEHVGALVEHYKHLLALGVCPEQARMVLPQNMMTEWWWSGSLGAWCDMLILRLDKHTQYETRVVAEKTYDLIEPLFPVSVKARMEAAGVSRY